MNAPCVGIVTRSLYFKGIKSLNAWLQVLIIYPLWRSSIVPICPSPEVEKPWRMKLLHRLDEMVPIFRSPDLERSGRMKPLH